MPDAAPFSATAAPAAAFRSTRPRTSVVRGAQQAHGSDFAELKRRVQDAGLLQRRYGWYVLRSALLAAAFAVAFTSLFLLGRSWWQLVVAGVFGLLFTQTAFFAHDGAHRQVFESGPRNATFSRLIGNLGVGLSYGWWMHKHSRHHANPNTAGKDDDIRPGALVFTPDTAAARPGLPAFLGRFQGWFFFPLLLLAGMDLHRNAIRTVLRGEQVDHRVLEAVLIGVRLLGFPAPGPRSAPRSWACSSASSASRWGRASRRTTRAWR